MLKQNEKDILEALGCEYRPVAVKFCYSRPEGVERIDKVMAFCQFIKEVQMTGRKFYMQKEDDDCFGKMVLGMIPKQPFNASGQVGVDFGLFRTPAPNAKLHNELPVLVHGSVNYVIFSTIPDCDFDPDLIIFVANTEQADIIMRASSYISGDLWESKVSSVQSCAWMYTYPYLSGKVNRCTTGMHHGMKRRKVYPAGLQIIAVPFQKIPEVVTSLQEMDWDLIAMREDEESKAELAARMAHWGEMQAQVEAETNEDIGKTFVNSK